MDLITLRLVRQVLENVATLANESTTLVVELTDLAITLNLHIKSKNQLDPRLDPWPKPL